MRFTELFSDFIGSPRDIAQTRLQRLINLQTLGAFILPIDHVTDCKDFFELCCGMRGVPTDKSQRLAVLSMREDRLTGRIRNFILVDTDNMLADGLTKPGIFKRLMFMCTTGIWQLFPHATRPVLVRKLQRTSVYEEDDLLDLKG